jgi:predicted ATPase
MTKDNFIVITGGPGSGKSVLLEGLSTLGYTVIPETARTIIKERLSKGLSPRSNPAEFARQIFDIDFKNYIDNIDSTEPLFFDRSFLDSAAMMFEANSPDAMLKETLNNYRYRKHVFIAPPWKEIYRTDSERDQSYENSVEIYQMMYKWYELNEYVLIQLPKTNIDGRISFILNTIK